MKCTSSLIIIVKPSLGRELRGMASTMRVDSHSGTQSRNNAYLACWIRSVTPVNLPNDWVDDKSAVLFRGDRAFITDLINVNSQSQ